tara:strand:+ start:381 stop:617 length:237 start_codon:yes stop_codon:yes gene_type:complete
MFIPVIPFERNRSRSHISNEQINLTFPEHKRKLRKRIKTNAKKLGVSQSFLIRTATEQFLDRNDELNLLQQAIIGINL